MIYERYRSKADYLGAHRSSPAFLQFRPKMKALQDAGDVLISGDRVQCKSCVLVVLIVVETSLQQFYV